jgi:LmbE family N-acetylglucosaminyl deacetylase
VLDIGLARKEGAPLNLLCIGAHSDDIEIGCGGTLLRLLEEIPQIHVHWVVLGASGPRKTEALASANVFLADARSKEIVITEFRDGFFPHEGPAIKEAFEQLKGDCAPDVILTHYRNDLHQDHRVVSELTWNTFRDHLILEYEIIKYDGDLGTPNCFVQLKESTCQRKVRNLMECFGSQRSKRWFTEDTFFAMLRLRGVECNAEERYAEAFYARKLRY